MARITKVMGILPRTDIHMQSRPALHQGVCVYALRFPASMLRPASRTESSSDACLSRNLAIFVKTRHTVFLISQPQR